MSQFVQSCSIISEENVFSHFFAAFVKFLRLSQSSAISTRGMGWTNDNGPVYHADKSFVEAAARFSLGRGQQAVEHLLPKGAAVGHLPLHHHQHFDDFGVQVLFGGFDEVVVALPTAQNHGRHKAMAVLQMLREFLAAFPLQLFVAPQQLLAAHIRLHPAAKIIIRFAYF